MVATLKVTDTTSKVITKPPSIKSEEAFPLAKDTLKKIPLMLHEIDSQGFPNIPGSINIDQRLERKNEINQYTARFYATNLRLKEKLNGEPIENLNKILKDISEFAPSTTSALIEKPLAYIANIEVLRTPHAISLIHEDPLITLSLITARGCGLYSSDFSIKKGALNMLIILGKYAGCPILEAKKLNKHLVGNLSTLSLIRNILSQQKERGHETGIIEYIKAIDNELEDLEDKALRCAIKLKENEGKEENKTEVVTQEKVKAQEKKETEEPPKGRKVTVSKLNLLD